MSETQVIKAKGWAVEARLPELVDVLVRANKQALKLGVPGITYRRGAVEDRVVSRVVNAGGLEVKVKARFVEVEIEGTIPVLPGGWTLIAVVNHEEGLPIVKNVPGQELPAGQRERGMICDHCQTSRGRKDTFVVRAENGDVRQVGRNCLADFLGVSGYSPEALLALIRFLAAPLDGFGDPDAEDFGYEGFARGRTTIDVVEVVQVAGAMIDEHGWVSRARSQASNGEEAATADGVARFLFPPSRPTEQELAERAQIRGRFTEALANEARAAIEWAARYEGDNDYLLNLKVIASREVVGFDKLGLAVSMMAAYRREVERLRERERKARSSTFIGEVKKREVFTLKLVAHRAIDGYYGTTHRCEFETASGATVVWWASNDPTYGPDAWPIGEERTVKATVKKHEEFKGLKTTVVTRVTEEAASADARIAARKAAAG